MSNDGLDVNFNRDDLDKSMKKLIGQIERVVFKKKEKNNSPIEKLNDQKLEDSLGINRKLNSVLENVLLESEKLNRRIIKLEDERKEYQNSYEEAKRELSKLKTTITCRICEEMYENFIF